LSEDRLAASVTAAHSTGSKVTEAEIRAAAEAQLKDLKYLFREIQRTT
jgi:hypothetical protein